MLLRTLFALGLLVCLTFSLSLVYAQTEGNSTLNGTVTDDKGNFLEAAEVSIPALQKLAYTNAQGLYAINKLPAGKVEIMIAYPGMDTLLYSAEIPANKKLKLDFVLKESIVMETVEIVEGGVGKIDQQKVNTGLTQISAKEINILPSLGVPDLAAYLQVVPGVVFTGDQGGQLYIRGGTPVQNLMLMDGNIIYNPFHTLGIFSIFDTDYIRTADVYTGGFSAEYGGRVSSVIDVKTRPGRFDRVGVKINATPIVSGALVEVPLGKKGKNGLSPASILVSGRSCYLDQTSKALYTYANEKRGLPFQFLDLYGKATLGNATNHLSLSGFHQRDKVSYGFPADYAWTQSGGGINFQALPRNTNMLISGNFSGSNFASEQISTGEFQPRRSSVGGFNGRLNFTFIINSINEFSYGLQVMGFNTNIFISNQYGNSASQEKFNQEFAGYLKFKKVFRVKKTDADGNVSYFNRFIVEPSFRIHYFNDQQVASAEPRLRMKLNFRRFSFQANGGYYKQNLMAATSDRDIVALFQGYLSAPDKVGGQGDKKNTLQGAWHGMGGVQVEIIKNLEFNVEGWYKYFDFLTNINRDRLFASDPAFISEKGTAYGFDVMLKYQNKWLYLYGTYGWAKVQRTDENFLKQTYFPIFDRRHNANAVADVKLGDLKEKDTQKRLDSKWEFSVRWTLGSGFAFTQTAGLFEKVDFSGNGTQTDYVTQNGQVPPNPSVALTTVVNGGRLPYYHRFDVSAKRRFLISKRGVLEVNINVLNTYNRANIFYYDRLSNSRVDQLPIMPTLGVTFTY